VLIWDSMSQYRGGVEVSKIVSSDPYLQFPFQNGYHGGSFGGKTILGRSTRT